MVFGLRETGIDGNLSFVVVLLLSGNVCTALTDGFFMIVTPANSSMLRVTARVVRFSITVLSFGLWLGWNGIALMRLILAEGLMNFLLIGVNLRIFGLPGPFTALADEDVYSSCNVCLMGTTCVVAERCLDNWKWYLL